MITHEQRVNFGRLGAVKRWSSGPSFKERFWSRVDIKGHSECWVWKSSINSKTGYGKVKINGQHTGAHRVAYELEKGPIPKGLHVLHKCDNRPCCNPAHLFVGTHQDNMDDMKEKGRASGPKSHLNYPRAQGEQCGNAVLNKEQVRQIRERYAAGGITQVRLGVEFGVGQDQISKIVNRKSWSHT